MKNEKKLYMIWKSANTRRRYKVAELVNINDEKYIFSYINPELNDAKKVGFSLYPGFNDDNKRYKSNYLFKNIAMRLPNKNRDDYNTYSEKFGILPGDSDFEILTKTKGKIVTDNIEFIRPFSKNGFEFEIAGIRYYDIKTIKRCLHIGDVVKLEIDSTNKFDEYAVKVTYEYDRKSYILGYVPRYYSEDVYKCIENNEIGVASITFYDVSCKEFNDFNSIIIGVKFK